MIIVQCTALRTTCQAHKVQPGRFICSACSKALTPRVIGGSHAHTILDGICQWCAGELPCQGCEPVLAIRKAAQEHYKRKRARP